MWHLPAKEQIPSTTIMSCPKPERLYLGFSSKCQGSRSRPYPCLFWRMLSISWFRVKGWGGVLLVFSSLAEMYSLTITMPADQRQREALSSASCAATPSTFLVGWPQGELGWERVLQWMAVWVWALAGWHSKSKGSISSFWVAPLWVWVALKALNTLQLVFDWHGRKQQFIERLSRWK